MEFFVSVLQQGKPGGTLSYQLCQHSPEIRREGDHMSNPRASCTRWFEVAAIRVGPQASRPWRTSREARRRALNETIDAGLDNSLDMYTKRRETQENLVRGRLARKSEERKEMKISKARRRAALRRRPGGILR